MGRTRRPVAFLPAGQPLSRPLRDYPGEADTKKATRVLIHEIARDLWQVSHRPAGIAVGLAGDGAMDVGCLLHLLHFQARDILMVDNRIDPAWAGERYGVRTSGKDLHLALRESGEPISFALLDFMGHMSRITELAILEVGKRLPPGGILFFTFKRGRENGMGIMPRLYGDPHAPDVGRFAAYERHLKTLLPGPYERVGAVQYSRPSSPMGVLGLQKLGPGVVTDGRRRVLDRVRPETPTVIDYLNVHQCLSAERSRLCHLPDEALRLVFQQPAA